jgi:hypothetical protein
VRQSLREAELERRRSASADEVAGTGRRLRADAPPDRFFARHQGSPVALGLALSAADVLAAIAADATMSA